MRSEPRLTRYVRPAPIEKSDVRRNDMKRIKVILTFVLPLVVLSIGLGNSTIGATYSTVVNVELALEFYQLDCGALPTVQQGLIALTTNVGVKGWNGPYIRGNAIPTDSWGNTLRYSPSRKKPWVVSAGPDAMFGTSDDIDSTRQTRPQTTGCRAPQ